jgi:hypothetical protein
VYLVEVEESMWAKMDADVHERDPVTGSGTRRSHGVVNLQAGVEQEADL